MKGNNFDRIDIYLNDLYFHDKRNGFYLEAGAYDGIGDSITYAYQKELGWKGLLIQPNINLIDSIKNRRNEDNIILNAGLGDITQIKQFQYLPSRADSSGFGLTVQQKEKLRRIGYNGISQKCKVQIYAYRDLIQKYGIKNIDIAVIDVEGYESRVLRNIMQSEIKPKFLVVQFINNDKKELIQIVNKEYKLIKTINKDLIFQKE